MQESNEGVEVVWQSYSVLYGVEGEYMWEDLLWVGGTCWHIYVQHQKRTVLRLLLMGSPNLG